LCVGLCTGESEGTLTKGDEFGVLGESIVEPATVALRRIQAQNDVVWSGFVRIERGANRFAKRTSGEALRGITCGTVHGLGRPRR
jgi:hypothetical protein